ncbi:TIGR03752 family integrating conjugative element protein [Alcaligenes faecalis]|uniref:TIGR03752 family integrating conjugative element protein n=1 Tax=Alcaligenes faecalis TaxID=511 RepID=UPI00203A5D48|nr:TIGR03752 family integrating conjugative element protein [Alcaligenes faecalis]MCM2621537.1 TIGR03752 family integrating conjugative element protein [Alcaligenes faecalis]
MSSTSSNKLIPILGGVAVLIVSVVIYRQFTGSGESTNSVLTSIPTPESATLPTAQGADNDNAAETLRTVTASNEQLRRDVARVIEMNNQLIAENKRMGGANATVSRRIEQEQRDTLNLDGPRTDSIDPTGDETSAKSAVNLTLQRGSEAVDTFSRAFQLSPARSETEAANRAAQTRTTPLVPQQSFSLGTESSTPTVASSGPYRVLPPMGYSAVTQSEQGRNGNDGPAITRYVRTSGNQAYANSSMGPVSRPTATQTRSTPQAAKPEPIPYFTVPENSTLVGAVSMTSLIGRVPIDGRVTDPMQFKAIVGRDNLAANGFELPADIEGMIVTGVAIGDMALSCSEGKVRSITFVFNDGTVRTISERSKGGGNANVNGSGTTQDLGYISDVHGNPCIPGKFVTNAPAYLADLAALKGLDVAAQAFSDAQRTVSNNLGTGNTTSQITGSRSSYAMGQAASGATNEVVAWMTSRLKNSFDAVVTPAGKQMVIHLDKELQIDKMPNARKLVYRQQGTQQISRGAHYGLE